MIAGMDVAMGGRVAEELIFGKENITSGAYSDIANATGTARAMVTKFGFSEEIGIVLYEGETGQQSASSATRAKIDDEVKKLTADAYERATVLLKKYSKEHKLLAETLLEYETLTGEEVREIIQKRRKPKRAIINTSGGARGDGSIFESKPPKKKSMIPAIAKVGSSRTEHADDP
jgi:ATP-dependent Zn protease